MHPSSINSMATGGEPIKRVRVSVLFLVLATVDCHSNRNGERDINDKVDSGSDAIGKSNSDREP